MATFDNLEDGQIGLIVQEGNRIIQLGIEKKNHALITELLAQLSKESPLIKMNKEYDLVLKSELINKLDSLIKECRV